MNRIFLGSRSLHGNQTYQYITYDEFPNSSINRFTMNRCQRIRIKATSNFSVYIGEIGNIVYLIVHRIHKKNRS